MSDFTNLVAIVTGGASGIGAATAALLAERGARVAVLDRDITDVDTTASTAVTCDITSVEAVDRAVSDVVAQLGGIDVLVNNAGIGAVGDVTQNDEDEWHRVLDVNVVGIARVSRAAMPHLRQSAHAAIVNTCSVVATVGVPQRAVYAASKGAVAALTLAMAADHVGDGVRVNAVTPGTAETPWIGRLLEQSGDAAAAAEALRARQPMGRLVTADEVAYAIAYLASPASASTTGTILAVDGGMSGLRLPR
jgi:2-keto-3-deoxy-L-fuconate dehydrogenase